MKGCVGEMTFRPGCQNTDLLGIDFYGVLASVHTALSNDMPMKPYCVYTEGRLLTLLTLLFSLLTDLNVLGKQILEKP